MRIAILDLKTFQKEHRKAIDAHDGEKASSGVRRVELFWIFVK
jgi:hypothetical protein